MKIRRLIAAMAATIVSVSCLMTNAYATNMQPRVDLSSTGAICYGENTSTDVEIISSRIVNQDDKNCNILNLNVGAKVSLSNIFKLADGYDFGDFTYKIDDGEGDKPNALKIVKSSGKYYIKAVKEQPYNFLRIYYKKEHIASVEISVDNSYKSASKISVSSKTVKTGQEVTLKGITSSKKYADCCWIIVGDSNWELPAAWYVNWNCKKSEWGKATLSFNDFGTVKVYCLSPNGKLRKVTLNITEEIYDKNSIYPDRRYFYDKNNNNAEIGYLKPDGTIVITNSKYEYFAKKYKYSNEKGCFWYVYDGQVLDVNPKTSAFYFK